MRLSLMLGIVASAHGFRAHTGLVMAGYQSPVYTRMQMSAPTPVQTAAALTAALGAVQGASAARSGGRVGGRVGGGGGGYGGGRRMAGGGGVTNVYMAPPMFSPFGFSPFGFSPFGFGLGFGLPLPLLLFAAGGLALTSFRSNRGIEASDTPGAALCLQVACYCGDRQDSLYSKLASIARTADANSYDGLQALVSDTCLAMLRSSKVR